METADVEPAQRIRVLWLIKGLGPGGAEHMLLDHARHGDAGRFEYRAAYLLPHKHHLAAPLRAEGVATACLDVRSALDPRWVVRLVRLLRAWKPDVVHVHSPLVAAVARLVVRALRDRPALVYTEHNRWSQYRAATRLANAVTYALDDAQIAVSDGVATTVPEPLQGDIEVLRNGIDVAAARSRADRDAVRAELGLDPEDVVVGTVANLRREKDYPNLLHAARQVLDRHPEVRFLAVGQGPEEEAVRDLHRRLDLGGRFQLLGYRGDAVRVVSGCDVFTLASSHEGLPLSLLEAMALGVPVVATAVGGIPEAVDDGVTGHLVPPHDADDLAQALASLVTNPDQRRAMAEQALARSVHFDSRPAIARLDAIYAGVVRRPAQQRA